MILEVQCGRTIKLCMRTFWAVFQLLGLYWLRGPYSILYSGPTPTPGFPFAAADNKARSAAWQPGPTNLLTAWYPVQPHDPDPTARVPSATSEPALTAISPAARRRRRPGPLRRRAGAGATRPAQSAAARRSLVAVAALRGWLRVTGGRGWLRRCRSPTPSAGGGVIAIN